MQFYVHRIDKGLQVEFYTDSSWAGVELCDEASIDQVVKAWGGDQQIFCRPIEIGELLTQLAESDRTE